MVTWQEPVFDRTQADVDYARAQLSGGINNVEYKGCFNPLDINRIEGDIQYLSDALNTLRYANKVSTVQNWAKESLPYKSQLDRIINNVGILWSKYHKPNGAVDLPTTLLTYEQVNALEKNIYLLKEMLDDMISSFRECGTFACGEE